MKSSIKKTTLITAMLALGSMPAVHAQTKKVTPAKKPATATATAKPAAGKKMADGFTKLSTGLEYKIVKHGTGKKKPVVGDHIEMFIHVHILDSVLFDSRKMYNKDNPVSFPISAPKFNSDPMEGFMLLVTGDSATIRVPLDSMKKAGNQLLPWMKDGEKIEYNVVLMSVRSDAEEKKYNEEKAAKQKGIDEKLLQEYFTAHNIKPLKTASGLYYTVAKEGTGETAKTGNNLSVNYTGKLLNGKTFDSNTDSAFHHTEPFKLDIGKGRVIKGWDEGLMLFNKGTKATLYIPSGLAYGSQDKSPQIPANSILVFDVEILDIKNADDIKKEAEQKSIQQKVTDDNLLKEYFAKNNIQATKTESGLYYVITQKGLGENAKAGQKITMNYTGKTLDGKTFDSNTDDKFHHVQPFTFPLGAGQVIKGWDEGVQLLNMGSKATLYIPSNLAYGEHGAGGAIPPNAVLMFDVEVTGIDK